MKRLIKRTIICLICIPLMAVTTLYQISSCQLFIAHAAEYEYGAYEGGVEIKSVVGQLGATMEIGGYYI